MIARRTTVGFSPHGFLTSPPPFHLHHKLQHLLGFGLSERRHRTSELYLMCSCLAVCTKQDWSVSFSTS